MSLDISLYSKEILKCDCGREHVLRDVELYDCNITHNLNTMAEEAGIYNIIWRPDELGIERAGDIVRSLEKGLLRLKGDPDYYDKFSASNGWGVYKDFVRFVENYLEACKKYPHARIEVGR